MTRRGNCYVTCEALYHLLGGKAAGWTPHTVRHEGAVHWFLVHRKSWRQLGSSWPVTSEHIIDPTARQFKKTPPYHLGVGRGFMTKKPSKRAREMMKRMVWQ